jgi:hypothetical protein
MNTGEMIAARPTPSRTLRDRAEDGFRATLRDGREIEVARMTGDPGNGNDRRSWTATTVGRRDPGYLGLAWFAPVPATAGHALAEVVVNHGLGGTGLALLLFDTVVLTATATGVGTLSLFLPAHAEDFSRAVSGLGGRIVSPGGQVMVVELPLGRGPRRYLGSGMHPAMPPDGLGLGN